MQDMLRQQAAFQANFDKQEKPSETAPAWMTAVCAMAPAAPPIIGTI